MRWLRHGGIVPPHLASIVYGWDYQGLYSCSLPQLSRLSVGLGPEGRLRHRCSTRYLRIPPLHRVFHPPLPDPSRGGSGGFGGLSPPLRPPACRAAYARFTPNESG